MLFNVNNLGIGAVALGRVPITLALGRVKSTTEDTRTICEAAADAARRGSPAAASLARQCAQNPDPLVQGPSGPAEEEGIPKAAMIAGGVVAVLALAAVAYKVTHKKKR